MPYECPACGRSNMSRTCANVHIPPPVLDEFGREIIDQSDDPFEGLDLDSAYATHEGIER